MDRNEEHEYYDKPENQKPQGKPRRRKNRLTELVPASNQTPSNKPEPQPTPTTEQSNKSYRQTNRLPAQ